MLYQDILSRLLILTNLRIMSTIFCGENSHCIDERHTFLTTLNLALGQTRGHLVGKRWLFFSFYLFCQSFLLFFLAQVLGCGNLLCKLFHLHASPIVKHIFHELNQQMFRAYPLEMSFKCLMTDKNLTSFLYPATNVYANLPHSLDNIVY